MKTKPYVGITGVTSIVQSEAIAGYAELLGWPRTHKVMVGALASYKGLRGRSANPRQYVGVDQIDSVFVNDRVCLNLIHYNSRANGLFAQLNELLSDARYVDGVQLNISWPWLDALRRLQSRFYTVITLQISSRAYQMIGGTPTRLVSTLAPYEGLIEYVLIDPSGGTGKDFDSHLAKVMLKTLVDSGLGMKWGIAGGLGRGKLERLRPLLEIDPGLSWDAQARLRTISDELDESLWKPYLEESRKLLAEYS